MSEQVVCQCCGAFKKNLNPKGSEVIKGNVLLLCNRCKADGHEPAHFIVIGAHSGKDIGGFVTAGKYCGELPPMNAA